MEMNEIENYFKEHKYVVIRKFLEPHVAAIVYKYMLTRAQATDYKYMNDRQFYSPRWDGRWNDPQSLDNFSSYGDPLIDSILELATESMCQYTGLHLIPNYSYWRLYEKGSVLDRHVDRPSCEISTTLCIGWNSENIKNEIPDYNWEIWVKDPITNKETAIDLEPGDMIIYRGCEIEHWREKYKGLHHAQMFMHYSDANGPFKTVYDGRPLLGIPKESDTDN
jgi:hypothetical protein